MDYLEYKGYKGTVEYSKEDDCLVGKVIGMHRDLILYEGNSIKELRQDFEDAVDSYIEGCMTEGIKPRKPFSGKLVLRMTSELHSLVAEAAIDSGTTINDYINKTLARELIKYLSL